MVKLRFSPERLVEASGLDLDVLKEALFRLKCETEELEDAIEVEVNPDRPDMFSVEGIARAVRGLMGLEMGWSPPSGEKTDFTIVNEVPPSRPIIMGAVVYDVNVDEEFLRELMQFQEKLHDTIGRKRRKVAIGIHDLSKVKGHRLRYGLVSVEASMRPLGNERTMTIREVLAHTEQGVKYGNLSLTSLEGRAAHPAILDEEGNVISLPPVINSDITRVEAGTRDLFIDVTGTDPYIVSKVLDVLASNLLERRHSKLGIVTISQDGSLRESPNMSTKALDLSSTDVNKVLGTDLTIDEIALSLLKMRFAIGQPVDEKLSVTVPPFRTDVLSTVDLVEDIAIALGYDSPELSPIEPLVVPTGSLMPSSRLVRVSRDIMTGLGFTELMSYLLTSSKLLESLGLTTISIRVKNPVQADLDVLRPSLAPSLLSAMLLNIDKRKPVKLFEIGKVVYRVSDKVIEERRLGAAIMDYSTGYEDIQGVAYSYLRALGLRPGAREAVAEPFIRGRTAVLLADERPIGVLGEVNPEVLERLGLDYPVAAFEVSLDRLLEVLQGGNTG